MSTHDPSPLDGTASASRLALALRAFRHRDYRIFFLSQLVSVGGHWMQTTARAWLMYRLTDSAVMLGAVAFCMQVPSLMLSPVAGALIDRLGTRRLLMAANTMLMAISAVLALLTAFGLVEAWHVLALTLAFGAAAAFEMPARQALVARMVGRQDLPNAIALNSLMFNIARVVGPALGGIVVVTLGEAWCFGINAATYAVILAGLAAIRVDRAGGAGKGAGDFLAGFRFLASSPPLRALYLVLGVSSVLAMNYPVVLPILADRTHGAGAEAYGTMLSAVGLGALLAALVLTLRGSSRGLPVLVGASAVGLAATLILFAWTPWYGISLLLLLPAGAFQILLIAGTNTLVQLLVPEALRGRVMAVHIMILVGLAPFGALLVGALTAWLGAPLAITVVCGLSLANAVYGGAQLWRWRRTVEGMLEKAGS